MSTTFTKLFSSITESTIWVEDDHTRLVWITMLAMADKYGRVWGSIPGLANRARVPLERVNEALSKFLGPDLYSRTPAFEGRRIEGIDGGWRLLNYSKYREIKDEEAIKESKRRYINARRSKEREAKRLGVEQSVENVGVGRSESNGVAQSRYNAEADAEADAEKKLKGSGDAKPAKRGKRAQPTLPDDEFIQKLKQSPAYSGIDIDRELAKIDVWLLTPQGRGRQKTRRTIVAWLNRIDRALAPFKVSQPLNANDIEPYWEAK